MKNRKRSKKPLGITARQGPRTGYPYVPWDVSEQIADTFLKHFSDNCTDNRIKPPSANRVITGGSATIPDAATGQPVPVTVVMEPTSEAFHDITLPIVGRFEGDKNVIRISPTIGACKSYESWRNILISAIRHELTHAADIYVYKTNRAVGKFVREYEAGKNPSVKHLPKPARRKIEELMTGEKRHKDMCTYVRDPIEQNAFLTQVGSELEMLSKKAAKMNLRYRDPADALANLSPTYREIGHCLTPKQKKRFQKMAATFWQRGVIPKK
jgi:hypothetical protein